MGREASALWNARGCPTRSGETPRQVRDLVRAEVHDVSLHEDFLQDALIHFWKSESQKPGQTPSWYLKSCWFHIQDRLVAGRSIDSFKRRHLQCPIPEESEDSELEEFGDFSSEANVVQNVAARDALEQLLRRLGPEDNAVLALLDQGYTICQIARRLCVSHPHVIRSRHRIAAMAIRIGFSHG
jgi:DNA-directed RNA polymerase specialized sigma24 family protein